nr:hypothetical protein [Burkholderiaceae bacterium]
MRRRPFVSGPSAVLVAALLACAAPSRAQAPDGAVALRLETELLERNLDADAPRPTFARGDAIGGRQGRETTIE